MEEIERRPGYFSCNFDSNSDKSSSRREATKSAIGEEEEVMDIFSVALLYI